VQRVTARADGRGDDRIGVEVGRRTRARQLDRRVGPADVAAGGVIGGVDRDRLDPEHGRRGHDADGDLAPVGDEQPLDHRPPSSRRDQTTPARQAAPGLPGLRMRRAAELDDDGRGGAAGAARERAAAHQTFYP
jgi:hypothetical protein